MTNNEDLFRLIDTGIYPKYLRNTQMHQVIALLYTLIEATYFGEAYQKNVVRTANVLGSELEKQGFQIVKKGNLYTQTHQVFLECSQDMMNRIFENGFKYGVTLNTKQKDLFHGKFGIRFGLQEVGRYDWDDTAMEKIAVVVKELSSKAPNEELLHKRISEMPEKQIHYTFGNEVIRYLSV